MGRPEEFLGPTSYCHPDARPAAVVVKNRVKSGTIR